MMSEYRALTSPKPAVPQGPARVPTHSTQEVDVVDRGQAAVERVVLLVEVAEVGPAVASASPTGAAGVGRPGVVAEAGLAGRRAGPRR